MIAPLAAVLWALQHDDALLSTSDVITASAAWRKLGQGQQAWLRSALATHEPDLGRVATLNDVVYVQLVPKQHEVLPPRGKA